MQCAKEIHHIQEICRKINHNKNKSDITALNYHNCKDDSQIILYHDTLLNIYFIVACEIDKC